MNLRSNILSRDVLHPNRANVSKEELRSKLADLYKSNQDQVSVFGLRTQYGGGKTTGFALVYDSQEALKKFEPHYRLVRIGAATKIEKASRQQRMSSDESGSGDRSGRLTRISQQASNGRTAPRSSAVSPRSRAPRRARTKRIASDSGEGQGGPGCCCCKWTRAWTGMRLRFRPDQGHDPTARCDNDGPLEIIAPMTTNGETEEIKKIRIKILLSFWGSVFLFYFFLRKGWDEK